MLTSACVVLFTFAAVAACLTITATLQDYAPDVALLRVRRLKGERPLIVSWRIIGMPADMSPAAMLRVSGQRLAATGLADRPAQPGSLRRAA